MELFEELLAEVIHTTREVATRKVLRVDFSEAEESAEKAIKELREFVKGVVYWVPGC